MKHTKSKKIIIDIRMINNSGIGIYIKNIVPDIIKHFKDHSFILLVYNNCPSIDHFKSFKNIRFINIKSKIYSISEQFEIFFKVPKKIDLYWSPHYLFPVLLNTKILLTIHDIYHLKYSTHFIKNIYSKLIYTFIRFKVDKIISVSNFTKKELIKHAFIKHNVVTTIHNGINIKGDNVNKKSRDIILTVGNFKKNKNIKILINSFEMIQNIVDHDLYIIGNYTTVMNVDRKLLKQVKENNRIHLVGEISLDELSKYYLNTILYIHPSLYEGFGFPPLEAMYYSCPTLVSNKSSIPEICGNAAEYFNPSNSNELSHKILNILGDVEIQKQMIQKGHNRLKEFDISKSINKTIKVIEEYLV